jgi:hypothetical protein
VVNAAGVLLHRLDPEAAVLLIWEILHVNPRFARNTSYKQFLKEHADLIA